MKILDWYLSREVSIKSLLVGLWLLLVYLFLSLLDQFEGGGEHHISTIVATLLYAIPRMVYELSPITLLVGTILGLAVLSRQSELVAFQAGGVSKTRIVVSVVGYSTVFALCMFLWGELIVPFSETKSVQVGAASPTDEPVNGQGVWHRHQNSFIHIDRIDKLNRVADVNVYSFDQYGQFSGMADAASGLISEELNSLHLRDIKELRLRDEVLELNHIKAKSYRIGFDELTLVLQKDNPFELNLLELYRLMKQRKAVGMNADFDELALWNRLIMPLSMLLMGMFAVLFSFRMKLRLNTGHFIMLGLLFGLFYFAVQQSVGYVAILLGITPIVGMFGVFLVFLAYALMALYRL